MFADRVRRESERRPAKSAAVRDRTSPKRPAPVPTPPVLAGAEAAWPDITRIRPRADAVIRRQTLTDAKQDADLTDTGETRAVVGPPIEGGGLAGRVYVSPATAKAADKASALKAAAVLAGTIGSRLHRWGEAGQIGGVGSKNQWTSPRMFTREGKSMNTKTVATVDPFFHRVIVPYTASGADQTLTMEYQHAATHQGYIARVTDSASAAVKTGSAMYHGKSSKKKLTVPGYSTQHAEAEENLLGLTAGSSEAAIDAYTKLAAEGSRWVCVRDNMAKLEDTSLFYCANPRVRGGVLTVRFLELWVSWASVFEKKYDIPNSEVIAKLKAGRIGGPDPATEIDPATDVNLEG